MMLTPLVPAVRAFANHHGDVINALVVHHHVHDLAGLGDVDGVFFRYAWRRGAPEGGGMKR